MARTYKFTVELPVFNGEARGSLRDCAHKLLEESAEASVAICKWDKGEGNTLEVMDELADVMQTLTNLMSYLGINQGILDLAISDCVRRNEKRGRY